MSKLYVFILDMVGTGDNFNNIENVMVGRDHVVIANSLQKARHMILGKHYYMTETWEETSDKKFDSLTEQEKESAMDSMFQIGEIFEIKMSEIDGIEKYIQPQSEQ